MNYYKTINIKSSGAITANGNSGAVDVSDVEKIIIKTVVSAVSGTSPTLDITIKDSDDGSTWDTVESLTQITAAGTVNTRLTKPTRRYIRVDWTVGGTLPSFTTEITAVGIRHG